MNSIDQANPTKSLDEIFKSLKTSNAKLAQLDRVEKDRGLESAASAIEAHQNEILAANAIDVDKARKDGMKESLVDRLSLNPDRISGLCAGIRKVISLDDPIGKVRGGWQTPNGLFIEQITVPMGTVCIIYESRPNVTTDAFSLAYKAGCSILLRGSSAALESNRVIVKALKKGLENGGIPGAVELAESGSRNEIDEILNARGWIDVVLPRGGRELIQRVVQNARIPVIETGEGNCHIFVDESADINNAVEIIANAKLQRPGVCNAVETLLLHRGIAPVLLPLVAKRLAGKAELRCDAESIKVLGSLTEAAAKYPALIIKEAEEEDWGTEYLDNILAIKILGSVEEAIEHINKYGTQHSEAILTNNLKNAEDFSSRVDAACVYVNASTRFSDGEMFGFGAELGISTQKFHVRGPMGLEALTAIKYRVRGTGQIRE